METTTEWYDVNDNYDYKFDVGDRVKFYDEASDTHKVGVVSNVCALARWKVTCTRRGWWIFSKRDYKYKPLEPSYIIIADDNIKWVVNENDIKRI